jgi:hypothetical protein
MVYRVKYIPTAVSAVGILYLEISKFYKKEQALKSRKTAVSAVGILYLEISKFYKKEQALKSGKFGVELYAEGFKIGTGSFALK